MNLFVTGGTGFIGSHFVERAMASGHELFCLRPSESPRIKLSKQPIWINGDLTLDCSDVLQKTDALVHFAAVGVSPQAATWEELFTVNVAQSVALWRHAVECGVRRFVICGSCFEYGLSAERFNFIPANAALFPINGYGASKAAATVAALAIAAEFDLILTVLRPFHVFGEGQHEKNLWPSLRRAALAGEDFQMTAGEQARDFTPVSLVAEAFLREVECGEFVRGKAKVKNVGTGVPITLRDFAEHWWGEWSATGKLVFDMPYRPHEIMRFVPQL